MSNRPEKVTNVLLDGDILAYRAAFSCQGKSVDDVCHKIDELIRQIEAETVLFRSEDNFEVYTTGKGNYRNDYAVTAPYKGNRKSTEKPEHLGTAYWYLSHQYGAIMVDGIEADDIISTRVKEIGKPETTVIATTDKDLKQCNCWNFNFVRHIENQYPDKEYREPWVFSTEWSGLHYFYEQILTGDTVDNIKGIYRVGPKKAQKLLESCKTPREMYEVCVDAYLGYSIKGSVVTAREEYEAYQLAKDRVQENGILLWLQDYEGQIWEPPKP